MSSGRNKPVLLTCENELGDEIEVVAKHSPTCDVGGLVREAICAVLAKDLGLPVPEPFVVWLSPIFLEGLTAEAKSLLGACEPYAFGSKRLPDGFGAWIDEGAALSADLDRQALDVMAFDCWLTNGDRGIGRHNLLSNGKEFAIFDHELALMTSLNLFWKPPWVAGSLKGATPPQGHVFYETLRGRGTYGWPDITQRLSAISDDRLHAYVEALPPSWTGSSSTATEAETFLVQLRDNAAQAIAELQLALQ